MRPFLPLTSLILLICLSLFILPAHAELFKWVDSSGKISYTDQPPPATAKALPSPNLNGNGGVTHNTAGKVVLVEGSVKITSSNGSSKPASIDDKIKQGDLIETSKNGELHLEMEDGGYLAVRPDTALKILEYRADGSISDKQIISLMTGSLRSISGWIGKYNRANYRIQTPGAAIGIRGTDHESAYVPVGVSGVEAGTYDKVNAGSTFIENKEGKIEVIAHVAGFAPANGKTKPRVLDRIPVIFKPTPNEKLMSGKHGEIQAAQEKRRQEHQKVVRERKQQEQKERQENAARIQRENHDRAEKVRTERQQRNSDRELDLDTEKRRKELIKRNAAEANANANRKNENNNESDSQPNPRK